VLGFLAGLAIGPVSALTVNASDTWVRGWDWPKVDAEYVLILLGTAVPAGINGAIGAGLAASLGRRRRLDITYLPAGLHVVAAILAVMAPEGFLLFQLAALTFSVVIWAAGRVGQVIGWRFRRWSATAPPIECNTGRLE